jgi:hypothetical protein
MIATWISPVRPVTVKMDRVTHAGTYYVQNQTVYVEHLLFGSKATQVRGTQPELMAWLLLSELVREGRKA